MVWQRIKMVFFAFIRLVHVMFQMLYGAWRVSSLPQPIVTIFGGSRFLQKDPYSMQANKFGRMLIEANISVLTGGGPGIMEAVSCGAMLEAQGKGKSMGIGVENLEGPNRCTKQYFSVHYFFARKWLLTRFSDAFVVFPGGFGTLDELFELFVLIQEKKMRGVPVILVGTEFWNPLLSWVHKHALAHHLVAPEYVLLFKVEDDLEVVLAIVKDACEKAQAER